MKQKNYKKAFIFFAWMGITGRPTPNIPSLEIRVAKYYFFAPDGPEICAGNPNGKQWFNIMTEDKLEIAHGLENSFYLLNNYIDENLEKYNLEKEDFFLVGFSQGTMLSLYTSIRRKCKGIIGYSGAFLDTELPQYIIRNDILLIHGELDSVVPVARMEYSKNRLKEFSNVLETKTYKNLDHSINEEGLKLGSKFIKKKALMYLSSLVTFNCNKESLL